MIGGDFYADSLSLGDKNLSGLEWKDILIL